jgi:glutamate-1-semialdehyde 2,1-aminomutase
MGSVDRVRLQELLKRELERYVEQTAASAEMFGRAQHLFGGVPMTWMNKWAGGHPIHFATAQGNRIVDVDGNEYIDFALGDTGAMAGHSPEATVRAVRDRIEGAGGITTMLPTDDAEWVAADLSRRFGIPLWSLSLTATDANRWALRIARMVTGRDKICAFSYCYHGAVDETLIRTGPHGSTIEREGNVGPAVPVAQTSRVAEFNDLDSVERALAHGDVAVLIAEPALTNIGIVLPEPDFWKSVRALCDKYETLLLIDETHTISAGPGGCTRAWNLEPDIVVIGKSIGGGVPSGAYGLSTAVANRITQHPDADLIDVGGVGGTLAGNALSTAAMRATLYEVLTDFAFDHMIDLATRFREGVEAVIHGSGAPWSVEQLGARVEYRFVSPGPRTGSESAAAHDEELEQYLHLFMANRGVLMTPFHNMALMCPATSADDVDRHTELFRDAVSRIFAA